jgi:hypothetical protein
MAALASDTFTGPNGSAFSATWTTGINPAAGGSTLIQSNAGRFTTGSVAGTYQSTNRIARRVAITAPVNAVALFSIRWPTAVRAYPRFYIRSTNTALDTQGGYWIELNPDLNNWSIGKGTAYASTSLPTNTTADRVAKTWVAGAKYWVRFGVVGSELKARVWDDGSPEPAHWERTATDVTHAGAGSGCGLTIGAGSTSGGGETVDLDDFSLITAFPQFGYPHTRFFRNYDYALLDLDVAGGGFIVGHSRLGIARLAAVASSWTSIKGGFVSISAGMSVRVVDGAWLEPEVSSLTMVTRDQGAFQTWDGDEVRLAYDGSTIFSGVITESVMASEIGQDNTEEFTVTLTARGFETIKNGLPAVGTARNLYHSGGGATPTISWAQGPLIERAAEITGRTVTAEDDQADTQIYERLASTTDVSGTQGELLADLAVRAGVLLDQSGGTSVTFRSYQDVPVWRLEDEHLVSGYGVAVDRESAQAVVLIWKEDDTFVRAYRAAGARRSAERTISMTTAAGTFDEFAGGTFAAYTPLQGQARPYLVGANIPRHNDLALPSRLPIRAHFRHDGVTYRGAVIALTHTISVERWMIGIGCAPVHLVTRVSDISPTPPQHLTADLVGTTVTLNWTAEAAGTVVSATANTFSVATASADRIDVGDELRLHTAAGALKEDTYFVVTAKAAPSGGNVAMTVSPAIAAAVAGDLLRFADYGITPDGGWLVCYQRGVIPVSHLVQPNTPGSGTLSVTTYTNSAVITDLLTAQTYRFSVFALSSTPNIHSAPSAYIEVVVP